MSKHKTLGDHIISVIKNHSALTHAVMQLISEAAKAGKLTVNSYDLIDIIQKDTDNLAKIQEGFDSIE